MQRNKQQALMFLLGAVLVGGVLGFSADRVMSKKPQRVSARMRMYDDIGIAPDQRVKMDSVLDETNCKTQELMQSVRPAMDSARAEGRKALLGLMTEPSERRTPPARRGSRRRWTPSTRPGQLVARAEVPAITRIGRGGGGGPGMGGPGPSRGPGGPFFR